MVTNDVAMVRSNKANTLFPYSSWAIVCMGLFMIFMMTPWFDQIDKVPSCDLLLRIVGGALGLVGGSASLIILFGMAIFCVREDRSPISAKIFWFIVSFATACFGAAAYFFTVYRKQTGQQGDMLVSP
jgi:hypothetical protein